jgi:hypothetical protein
MPSFKFVATHAKYIHLYKKALYINNKGSADVYN